MLVVDASVAVELSLDRIGDQAGAALGNGDLIGPPLLWSETPSALREMVFRREISEELAELALNRFLEGELSIANRRPEGLTSTAWRVAREFGWAKTYDAEYVALAMHQKCWLVTFDRRLRRGANRLGFVVTPTEIDNSL